MVHMAQHTVLTLVMPPILLMATPEWLARLVLGSGRVHRWVHRLARPLPALLIFNSLAPLIHWQVIVNNASTNGLFHYRSDEHTHEPQSLMRISYAVICCTKQNKNNDTE